MTVAVCILQVSCGYSPISPWSFRSNSEYLSAKQRHTGVDEGPAVALLLSSHAAKLSAFEQAPRQGFGDISKSLPQLTADGTKGKAETADNGRRVCESKGRGD